MKNPPITQAYKAYYDNILSKDHNNPDLIGRWGADPSRFETQILCHKSGTKVADSALYEEDGEVFGPQRWPYNAMDEPTFSDPPIRYLIGKRMKAIGSTWWDWKNRQSYALGFDFDSLLDHVGYDKGIPQHEIEKLDNITVPWLEINRSTRGNGRHIYIRFAEPYPETMNHSEHAALAKALLPLLAKETGFDLRGKVDCFGAVLWIHHVNATKENRGFECIKPATDFLTAKDIPLNWRDNIEVVSGSRTRVRVQGWTPDGPSDDADSIDEMTQAVARVPLDEAHIKVLEALEGTGHTSLWVHDHHLWQGHTAGLKQVYDEFADKGDPLRGLFDTNSLDSDPGKPNCLCADTQVITRQGLKPIGELAGKNVEIITARGARVTAPFKSYGVQDVYAVTLRRGDDTRVIKATGDHRWYVCKYTPKRKSKVKFGERKEVVTTELEKDQILVQTKPQLVVKPSVVGIQHGLVWGDGTNGGVRKTSSLSLFGEKDAQLLKFFSEHPQRPINKSVGGVEVWNLPYHFKSLVPLDYDLPYLYGWLAGYFAADGCVSDSGSCVIRSADEASIKHVRDVCHILGIETSQISSAVRGDSTYKPGSVHYATVLKAGDLTEDFFLIEQHRERWSSITNRQHRYWRVESVEPAGSEEVFCCTVPETHCFCLEDFVLIGNCFMRPKPDGAWDVYRFGENTPECSLWDTHGKWTHIPYNFPATLRQIALAAGGYEGTEEKQGFLFDNMEDLMEALKLLKAEDTFIPDEAAGRSTSLHAKGSAVILVIEKKRGDDKRDFPKYVKTPRGWETRLWGAIEIPDEEIKEEKIWTELDQELRALKVECEHGGKFDSWVLNDESGRWVIHPRENVKSFLVSKGHNKPDGLIGSAIYKSWTLVNEPFQPEYPGGRVWNRDAAQFVYAPAELKEGETPTHPTWTRLMEHCAVELNEYIDKLEWCKKWGITTGGDYLTAWVACMIQNPFGKLPYLFMYGPQNSGKSSFHEAIGLLFTRGVKKADRALTSEQGYNGELEDAVMAVIDEVDVAKAGSTAYNKLKEWVTALTISIHAKYKSVRDVPSTLHFVQVSNDRSSLPVFPGDTRITAMNVPALEEEIPRDQLRELLKKEASHFMRTLVDFDIPEANGRLMLPIIETQGKMEAAAGRRSELEVFVEENCYRIEGQAVKFSDFKTRFLSTVEEVYQADWKDGAIATKLSEMGFPVGKGSRINQKIIGNMTFNPKAKEGEPYKMDNGKVVRGEQ